MKTPSKLSLAVALVLVMVTNLGPGAAPVQAADHLNLEEGLPVQEEGLPVQVEDAYPIPYRGREFQGLFRYERTGDHKDRFVLDPRLELGFAPNWEAKLSVPFLLGSADKTGSGDIGLEALYNLNAESLRLPAFTLSARADFPTGRDSAGVDTTLKFITTKTLGNSSLLQRLHLNLSLDA
jgi:hypothetical protein